MMVAFPGVSLTDALGMPVVVVGDLLGARMRMVKSLPTKDREGPQRRGFEL